MSNPRLRMLVGYSGNNFSLAPGDETERFSDKEAKRLIAAEHAVKVAPPKPPKPETKQEWEDEREALMAENTQLKTDLDAATTKLAELTEQSDAVNKAALAFGQALGLEPRETAVAAPPAEKRG